MGPDGDLAYEQQRSNVAGLSVEYARRDAFTGAWSEKGLLDFNVLHADWPQALPTQMGGLPRCARAAAGAGAGRLQRGAEAWEAAGRVPCPPACPCRGCITPPHTGCAVLQGALPNLPAANRLHTPSRLSATA